MIYRHITDWDDAYANTVNIPGGTRWPDAWIEPAEALRGELGAEGRARLDVVYGPGERTIGHSGWGGSCAFADPDRRLSGAYVMNRQSSALIDDPRARRLIEAAYQALG